MEANLATMALQMRCWPALGEVRRGRAVVIFVLWGVLEEVVDGDWEGLEEARARSDQMGSVLFQLVLPCPGAASLHPVIVCTPSLPPTPQIAALSNA